MENIEDSEQRSLHDDSSEHNGYMGNHKHYTKR